MEKEVTNILIANRHIRIGELFSDNVGLGLKNRYKTFPSLVEKLDEILYILNKLEKENYIKIKHIVNNLNEGADFFNGIPVENKDEKVDITVNKLYWFVNHVKEIYPWEITTESGIIEYKKNNYKTHEEINWNKTRNLSLCIALITAVITAVLSAWLTHPPVINCFSF
jgi:hypothetical protein